MTDTIEELVTNLRDIFPDISTAKAEKLINLAIGEICDELGLLQKVIQINLVKDVGEYVIGVDKDDERISLIRRADYVPSAGADPIVLEPVDSLFMDYEDINWRYRDSAQPIRYYIAGSESGTVIGFDPKPDTTTTNGYPHVLIYCHFRPRTLSGVDRIPAGMGPSGSQYLVWHAACEYAFESARDRIPEIHDKKLQYRNQVLRFRNRLNLRDRARIFPVIRRTSVI